MTGLALTPILKTQRPTPMYSLKLAILFLHRDKIFPQVGLIFVRSGQQFSRPIGFTKFQSKSDGSNMLACFSNISRSLGKCGWYGWQNLGWKVETKLSIINQVFITFFSWILDFLNAFILLSFMVVGNHIKCGRTLAGWKGRRSVHDWWSHWSTFGSNFISHYHRDASLLHFEFPKFSGSQGWYQDKSTYTLEWMHPERTPKSRFTISHLNKMGWGTWGLFHQSHNQLLASPQW